MRMSEMKAAFDAGKIDKRVYWPLMRERFSALDECRELLDSGNDADNVDITKDGVVLGTEGIKLLFDFSQKICRAEGILSGTERESLSTVSAIAGFCLPKLGGGATSSRGVILDIGANVGRVCLALHKDHPDCVIYALEPVKGTFEWMLRNLALNGVDKDAIIPLNMGLYSSAGDMKFFVPIENETASMRPIDDKYYIGNAPVKETMCAVTTLDDFVLERGIDMMHFIKIDTEGAEKMVLMGGQNVLRKMRPAIYTEMLRKHSARFGYHPNEIIDMMASLGYGCYTETDGRLSPFAKMDESTIETNFFFLHKEKHESILSRMLK